MNISTAVPWPLVPTGAVVRDPLSGTWCQVIIPYDAESGRVLLDRLYEAVTGWARWTMVDPVQCPPMLVPTHDEAVAILRAAGWEIVRSGH